MALAIALMLLAAAWIWTFWKVPAETAIGTDKSDKDKLREHLVLDIRGANQYCLAYAALLGVIATIVVSDKAAFAPLLKQLPLWPFSVALLAAAISTIFVPAGYGRGSFGTLRLIWLRTILCEQVVVILTCYGIWELLMILRGQPG